MSGYYVEIKYGSEYPWEARAGPFPTWEAAYGYMCQVQQQTLEAASAIASTSLSDLRGRAAAHHFLTGDAEYRVVSGETAIPMGITIPG